MIVDAVAHLIGLDIAGFALDPMQAPHAATGQWNADDVKFFAVIGGAHFQPRKVMNDTSMSHGMGLLSAEFNHSFTGRVVAKPFSVIGLGRAADGGHALQLIQRVPGHRLCTGGQILLVAVCVEITREVRLVFTLVPG